MTAIGDFIYDLRSNIYVLLFWGLLSEILAKNVFSIKFTGGIFLILENLHS